MNPQRNLRYVEFAQRSLVNYRIILSQPSAQDRYEVTALLTALVSIFVWMKEEYFDTRGGIVSIRWDQLAAQFDSHCRRVPAEADQDQSYAHFLVNLRHGIAHGNIDLGNDEEVKSVTIWNSFRPNRWCATLPVEVLELVARDTVFDLNAAAVATFTGNSLHPLLRDIPYFRCACEFSWIGPVPPHTCPICRMAPTWCEVGALSSDAIESWPILRTPPTYCFEQ